MTTIQPQQPKRQRVFTARLSQWLVAIACMWSTTALAIDKLVDHPTKHVAAVGIGDQYGGAGIGYRYRFDFGLEAGAAFGAWNEGPYGALVVRQTLFAMLPIYVQGYFGPAVILEGQPTGGITATHVEGLYHTDVYDRAPMGPGASLGLHVNRKRHHIDFNYGWSFNPGAPSFVLAYGRNFGPRTLQPRDRSVEMNDIGECLAPATSTNLACRAHRSKVTAYRICNNNSHNPDDRVFACALLQKNFAKLNVPQTMQEEIRQREATLNTIRATLVTAAGHQPWEAQLQSKGCHELDVTNATRSQIGQCDALARQHSAWWGQLMVDVDMIRTWTVEVQTNGAMAASPSAPYAMAVSTLQNTGCPTVDAARIAYGQINIAVLERCKLEKQNFDAGLAHVTSKVTALNAALPVSAGHTKYRPEIEALGCTNVTVQRVGTGHIQESLIAECQALVDEHNEWWLPLNEGVDELNTRLPASAGHTKYRPKMEETGCIGVTAQAIATGDIEERIINDCTILVDKHAAWVENLDAKIAPIVWSRNDASRSYEWRAKFTEAGCNALSTESMASGT